MPVQLDFSKAQPIQAPAAGGVQLDFSKAQQIDPQDNSSFLQGVNEGFVQPTLHMLNPLTYVPGFVPDKNGIVNPPPILDDAINTVKSSIASARQSLAENDQTAANPNLSTLQKIGQGANQAVQAIPVVGPAIRSAEENYKAGNRAETWGQGVGLAAQIAAGHYAPEALQAVNDRINPLSPKAAQMVNDHIGLNSSDFDKWKRTDPQGPIRVGNTVQREAGFNGNLNKQYTKINQALDRLTDEQEARIDQHTQTSLAEMRANQDANVKPGSKLDTMKNRQDVVTAPDAERFHKPVDVHATLLNQAEVLKDELAAAGTLDEKTAKAVDYNRDRMMENYPQNQTGPDMVKMRRGVKPDSFNPGTNNIGERFHQLVYHDLNNRIEQLLPPDQATAFRATNQKIHDLIIAKQAAGEKLFKGNLRYDNPAKAVVQGVTSPKTIGDRIPNARLNAAQMQVRPALKAGLSGLGKVYSSGAPVASTIISAGNADDDQ